MTYTMFPYMQGYTVHNAQEEITSQTDQYLVILSSTYVFEDKLTKHSRTSMARTALEP